MSSRTFDVAILGAGPAGLVAAIAAARHSEVALVAERLPSADDPLRVDAVPAAVLALLTEFDLSPRLLEVHALHDVRVIAWESSTPVARRCARSAHVERPRLDLALFARVARDPRITVFVSTSWLHADELYWGDGWAARRLIDATGRAAATANDVIRPPQPWAARALELPRASARAAVPHPFALASLPDGYAYRLESSRRVTIGVIGRSRAVEGPPDQLEAMLIDAGHAWLLGDLPPLAESRPGRTSTASVQWLTATPREPTLLCIGDAALARDPLSSQGIAIACSEALAAAALPCDTHALRQRQREQRREHLAALSAMIATCSTRDSPTWRAYADFMSSQRKTAPDSQTALKSR